MSLKNNWLISASITVVIILMFSRTLMPDYFFAKGKFFYEKKDYINAEKYLQRAVFWGPDNVDYRYYFVKSLSELKPTYEIQKTMYKIAKGNKGDGAQILALEQLTEWKKILNKNVGNNYIEQAPSDANIIRWNKNSFPLPIYVDTAGLNNLPDFYKAAVLRAFHQWESSVNFVKFVNAKNKASAKILISFEKLPDNVCTANVCKYVVGYTTPKISGKTLKHMTITIYDKNPNGEYFSDKEIYNTALHELGHALGIMGHSYSTDDLMYQQNKDNNSIYAKYRSDFAYLNGVDVNTLKLLYMLEPTITDNKTKDYEIYTPIILGSPKEMASKKVEEALDYIKSSPDLAVGYINLAGAYADLKEYNKAIESLQKGATHANSQNEKFTIYYNVAYVYMNMEKYDSALEYAEYANAIQSSPDVLELISAIKHNQIINK